MAPTEAQPRYNNIHSKDPKYSRADNWNTQKSVDAVANMLRIVEVSQGKHFPPWIVLLVTVDVINAGETVSEYLMRIILS